ncbi:MAG: ribosome recycling factor [Alphaproteobacteria bacterium]|jgi:ribosome recycling factor|nr:ribosome recycling factor [Thalassospira sp.]MCE2964752.1 ribosome recycling factor [Alphaproteobacteria bacterium]
MTTFDVKDYKRRMTGAVDTVKKEYIGLRTGRASISMLDPVTVEVYGSRMPLNQLAAVSTPEARLISVQVWDKENTKAVEKAIRDAGLGLNPMSEGQLIRVPVPELSAERRQELVKVAGKYAEAGRVSVRNVRRDGMDALKKSLKDKVISEDEEKRFSKQLQDETDAHIKQIDEALAAKEKDITTV